MINHPRRILKDGLYRCLYTEELAQSLESCLVLEMPFEPGHLRPVDERRLLYTDAWFLPGGVVSRLIEKFYPQKYHAVETAIGESMTPVFSRLEEISGKKIDKAWCAKVATRTVLAYPLRVRLIRSLLRRISPKAIVEVVGYSPDVMLINEVAKELGIPTVELQHGPIGASQRAYHYAPGFSIKQFPDYLLTFSDFWSRSSVAPIPSERVISVGYPYLEQRMMQCKTIPPSTRTILFLSSLAGGPELASIAVALSKHFSSESLRILFKLHPFEYERWRDLYPDLAGTEIEVIDRRDVDVYDCFAQANIQVGVASTAIYEGLAFGLATYILRTDYFETNHGEIRTLCMGGYGAVFSSAEELIALLQNETPEGSAKAGDLWKSNALANIQAAIQEIVSKV